MPDLHIFHCDARSVKGEGCGRVIVKVAHREIFGVRVRGNTPIKVTVAAAVSGKIRKALARGIIVHIIGAQAH